MIASLGSSSDGQVVVVVDAEERFVAVAADYAVRHGIEYATWRDVGVEPSVLRRAGIVRYAD